jgi:hypothetical protein
MSRSLIGEFGEKSPQIWRVLGDPFHLGSEEKGAILERSK